LRRGARIAPRILECRAGGAVRATFVATQAGPLAGDRDSIRIVVGPAATLILTPVAATVALPGEARTVLTLDVVIHAGGRLVLDEPPLIVAGGANVQRRSTIELHDGAVAALRDTVGLGRHGEPPGVLDSTLRATLAGGPLLHDGLRIDEPDPYVALPAGHRVITTLCLLGTRPAVNPPPTLDAAPSAREPPVSADPARGEASVLALAGPGALARATGISRASPSALTELWQMWVKIASTHDKPSL
jgi:urease accessory protein